MAIIKSAKKAHRQSLRRRVYNVRRTRAVKDTIKDLEKAVVAGSKAEAIKLLPLAYQAIDKAAKRGVLKKNTASRNKAKAARLVAGMK